MIPSQTGGFRRARWLWALVLVGWAALVGVWLLDAGPLGLVGSARPLMREARGLWVVRDALAEPTSIDAFLNLAHEAGFNMLLVQVNGRAEAYYRSNVVPRVAALPEGFDPLAYLLEGARERGLEVHAWVNAFTAGMLQTRPSSRQHVLSRHPEWVTYDQAGRSLWDYGAEITDLDLPAFMLDPGLPEVQDFVVSMVVELVERYDVDGIHLDYVRYPDTRFGYHPQVRRRFQERLGVDPLWLHGEEGRLLRQSWGDDTVNKVMQAWNEWRRQQVTGLVRRVYQEVTARKPWVKVSAAVYADRQSARERVLQDWEQWLKEGIVDAVVPMAYLPDEQWVATQLREAVNRSGERHVYGGLGAYRVENDLTLLRRLVSRARRARTQGIVLFSYATLRDHPEMTRLLRDELFAVSALVPEMPWKPQREAAAESRGGQG